MNKIISALCIVTVFTLLLIKQNPPTVPNVIPSTVVRSQPTELEKFLHQMAMRESNNTPTIVNQYGMLGKYQFAKHTIAMLGYTVTPEEFLKNSKLQDSVMIANMRLNNKELVRRSV